MGCTMKKYAIGMLTHNRWKFTKQSLYSLYYNAQPKDDYDLYIIDSSDDHGDAASLEAFVKSNLLPVKNVFYVPSELNIAQKANLFLCFAAKMGYEYMVKMDNDVVLKGALSGNLPAAGRNITNGGWTLPIGRGGEPAGGPPITGMGAAHNIKSREKSKPHNRFLDHMAQFSKEFSVPMVSLVPVTPGQSFSSMWESVVQASFKGQPFLFGSLMMLSKECQKTIGFFNEFLPRQVDIEISQRLLRSGHNIGYHPFFHMVHIGATQSTETPAVLDKKYEESKRLQNLNPLEGFVDTMWSKSINLIIRRMNANKFITIEDD